MTDTSRWGMTYLSERMNGAEFAVNDLANIVDVGMGLEILDRNLSTPPGSPANGDAYIVAATGTGDWTGKEGLIAYYYDGWKFITPTAGMLAWINDEVLLLLYNGTSWVYPNPAEAETLSAVLETDGNTGTPSVVTWQLQDRNGNNIAATYVMRIRVCNSGGYANATNATVAAGTGSTSVSTITAGKDLIIRSNSSGLLRVNITNATAELNTVRCGMPRLSGRKLDYTVEVTTDHTS